MGTSASRNDAMQVVARPYILLGQSFALIPVRGIMSDDPKDLVWGQFKTLLLDFPNNFASSPNFMFIVKSRIFILGRVLYKNSLSKIYI